MQDQGAFLHPLISTGTPGDVYKLPGQQEYVNGNEQTSLLSETEKSQ